MARLLRADDVERATFTQTQFREGYDEREVDELLEDVVATLRRYESGSPAGGFRMDSTALGSVRFTPTRLRRGYDHAEIDAFLADVAHTLAHHEAARPGEVPETATGPVAVEADAGGSPAVVEREPWGARVLRILRGEDG